MKRLLGPAIVAAALFCGGAAWADCNQPGAEAVTQVPVAGHPFSAIPTADGCTVFVSLGGGRISHLAVYKRDNGQLTLVRSVPTSGMAMGLALSPDGKLLAMANGDGAHVFDTAGVMNGDNAPLHSLADGPHAGSIYVAFSPDGRLLFVTNERSASISVYDVTNLPAMPRLVGTLATGGAPVGLAFSPDGKLLYSTSEVGMRSWGAKCTSEGAAHPQGALLVYDLDKATANPGTGMVAGVAAGCNAVRVALSSDGSTAYVTARGENAVHILDTSKLIQEPAKALKAAVTVGASPVGVAVAGGHVFVTNSDRFGGSESQSVSVLDAAHPEAPAKSIPAGGFPRELKVTGDGNTLLVTNFGTNTVELVDLKRLDQAER